MATGTIITRAGSFDFTKLPILEERLAAAGLPRPFSVNGSDTGFYAQWPNGLTAPQTTQATTIINAWVEPPDAQIIPPVALRLFQFSQLASPTAAQTQTAVQTMARLWARLLSDRDRINGIDVTG